MFIGNDWFVCDDCEVAWPETDGTYCWVCKRRGIRGTDTLNEKVTIKRTDEG